jgi:hypothetical protein
VVSAAEKKGEVDKSVQKQIQKDSSQNNSRDIETNTNAPYTEISALALAVVSNDGMTTGK